MFCVFCFGFNSELNKDLVGGRWSAAQRAHSMPPKHGSKTRGRAGAGTGAGGEMAAILGSGQGLQPTPCGATHPATSPAPQTSRIYAWRLPPHTPGRWCEYHPNFVQEETGSHRVCVPCDRQHRGTESSSNPPCQNPELYVSRARGTLAKSQVRQSLPVREEGGIQNQPLPILWMRCENASTKPGTG